MSTVRIKARYATRAVVINSSGLIMREWCGVMRSSGVLRQPQSVLYSSTYHSHYTTRRLLLMFYKAHFLPRAYIAYSLLGRAASRKTFKAAKFFHILQYRLSIHPYNVTQAIPWAIPPSCLEFLVSRSMLKVLMPEVDE